MPPSSPSVPTLDQPTSSWSAVKRPEPSDCREKHSTVRSGVTHSSSGRVSERSTHSPGLKTTVQLGQQSWLTRHRLGKRPTPTACRPLWSLSVKPLQFTCGREKHHLHIFWEFISISPSSSSRVCHELISRGLMCKDILQILCGGQIGINLLQLFFKCASLFESNSYFYSICWIYDPGASHKQHRYICRNIQQYTVWVKIINFYFMPKIIRY